MKNAGGKDGVSLPFLQDVRHVFEFTGATARDDRNADGFANAPRDFQIEAGFGSVRIDAVQNDLA